MNDTSNLLPDGTTFPPVTPDPPAPPGYAPPPEIELVPGTGDEGGVASGDADAAPSTTQPD